MKLLERTVARPKTRRWSQQPAPSSLTRAGAALGRRDLRASPARSLRHRAAPASSPKALRNAVWVSSHLCPQLAQLSVVLCDVPHALLLVAA